MEVSLIIGIIITLLFSAFFSGMEIAFISSNRMLIEMDKEKQGLAQRVQSVFFRRPNNFVSTMLVGNNIALVIYGILFARLFDATVFRGMEPGWTVISDTIISTLVVLFVGEFLPKMFFSSSPNKLLSFFAIPAYLIYLVLWPISRFATFLSRILLSFLGIKIVEEPASEKFSKTDLNHLVQASLDNAPNEDDLDDEVRIFQNALELRDTKVRDCMIPRTEINAVSLNDTTLESLAQKFIETGNSKLIVYEDDIDHIVGYIHSSELFRNPLQWKNNIKKVSFVPETMAAQKFMSMLMAQKKSLGVVVDEYGGTSGIIALEDIVEEIFGEIEDEHDSQKYVAKQLASGEFVLSARLEVDRVNELFDLDLPENDRYMTIGGLILHAHQSFPKVNEQIKIGNYTFKIMKTTTTKIELVGLKASK